MKQRKGFKQYQADKAGRINVFDMHRELRKLAVMANEDYCLVTVEASQFRSDRQNMPLMQFRVYINSFGFREGDTFEVALALMKMAVLERAHITLYAKELPTNQADKEVIEIF